MAENVVDLVGSSRQLSLSDSSGGLAEVACPICLEFFREPKSLSCGHSLCGSCVEKMIHQKKISIGFSRWDSIPGGPGIPILCPSCRIETVVPHKGLPTNYGLQDLLCKFEAMETKQAEARMVPKKQCLSCQSVHSEENFWHCQSCSSGAGAGAGAAGPLWVCSTCGLKYHNGHNLVEFAAVRDQMMLEKQRCQRTRTELGREIDTVRENGMLLNEVMLNIHQVVREKVGRALESMERKLDVRGDQVLAMATKAQLDSISAQRHRIGALVGDICSRVERARGEAQVCLQECLNEVLRVQIMEEQEEGHKPPELLIIDEGSPDIKKYRTLLTKPLSCPVSPEPERPGGSGVIRNIAVARRRVKVKSNVRPLPKFGFDEKEDF